VPLIAHVDVQLQAGASLPAPAIVVVTYTDADTGDLVDCANADLRQLDPVGDYVDLALVWQSTGTYHAGSLGSPVTHPCRGTWTYEARSSVLTDLCAPDTTTVDVVSDGFAPITVPGPVTTPGHASSMVSHVVTQAEIDAGTPVQIALLFVPTSVRAGWGSGGDISDFVTCDGVHAYALLAMNDGVNPSPFYDGAVVQITAAQ